MFDVNKLKIYNLALAHLGMDQITSVDQDTPSADTLNIFYDQCINDLFSESRWPFATVKEAIVSVSDDTLELEWEYCYLRPVNACAVWNVYNEATISTKEEQEFETVYQPAYSRLIIGSNLSDAYAEYTYKVVDTALYSPKFIMAASYKLAAAAAPNLLADMKKSTEIMNMAQVFIESAKALGASEKKKKTTVQSSYRESR